VVGDVLGKRAPEEFAGATRAVPLDAMGALARRQRPGIPLFTPALPVAGMPDRAADSTALYAGETVS